MQMEVYILASKGENLMRTLINYIRSCFCKHEWECLLDASPAYVEGHQRPRRYIWLYRCKKCGLKNKVTSD
jgi:hypothetical protein